ncbi:MAG: type transport system ATP-binding protein, partial [Patescibacteria group bacterium]|nr:type transport system ATP-binding protein [Patescibacteria group bacterium]
MSIKCTAWGYINMDDDIAIKVQGVSKTFKDQAGATTIKNSFIELGRKIAGKPEQHKKKGFTALKDINFEVKRGEFFGIVGRNGCGKSTLLKIMAGVYTPTKGAVVVNGKLTPFIELGVGFNPELSGRDNVFLNGALLGFNRKQMEAMYKDIVDFAELHEFMDM